MDEGKAQQIIILCAFVTIGSTSVAELKQIPQAKTLHPHRTIVGGFFAMLGCSIIAELDPKTGMLLAIMVAGGTFIKFGLPTVDSYYATEGSKGKSKPASKAQKQQFTKVQPNVNNVGQKTQVGLKGLF